MGEYFDWFNYDRREQLNNLALDSAPDLACAEHIGAGNTEAALTLLEGDWAGETVAFVGDYSCYTCTDNPLMLRLRCEWDGNPWDGPAVTFKDISGRFEEVRGMTYYDDDNNVERPYDGPFDLHFTHPRYLVNLTKHEFIDRSATGAMAIWPNNGFEVMYFDPTPLLLCTWVGLDGYYDLECGPWLGDFVFATSTRPDDGYTDSTRHYADTDVDEPLVYATPQQLRAVIEGRPEGYEGLTDQEVADVWKIARWR